MSNFTVLLFALLSRFLQPIDYVNCCRFFFYYEMLLLFVVYWSILDFSVPEFYHQQKIPSGDIYCHLSESANREKAEIRFNFCILINFPRFVLNKLLFDYVVSHIWNPFENAQYRFESKLTSKLKNHV